MSAGKVAVLRRCQVQDVTRSAYHVGVKQTGKRLRGRRVYEDAFGARFVVVDE